MTRHCSISEPVSE